MVPFFRGSCGARRAMGFETSFAKFEVRGQELPTLQFAVWLSSCSGKGWHKKKITASETLQADWEVLIQ